jgi:sulfur relay protein TusB/DsrH
MLHLIIQAPLDLVLLDRMAEGDIAVFMESAVLSVLKQSRFDAALTTKLITNRLCVMEDDIQTRGILQEELVTGFEVIDYAALVILTVENKQIITWR